MNWYHCLPTSIQADWKELCQAFVHQYSYNAKIEVSLVELTDTMQQPNESFADFFIRWKNKAALLRQKPSELDQVGIMMKNVLPSMTITLKSMNPTDFKKLYQAGLLCEEIERDKQKALKGKVPYAQSSTQNHKTVDINQVQTNKPLRKFSNFNRLLSKVFERLEKQGLLKPEPSINPPNTNSSNYNPNVYCYFHQIKGHHTDDCLRLKHEIQDLIDAGKITNPEARPPC